MLETPSTVTTCWTVCVRCPLSPMKPERETGSTITLSGLPVHCLPLMRVHHWTIRTREGGLGDRAGGKRGVGCQGVSASLF